MPQINSRIRLVRLRPEFASLYPGLDPGVWETATELGARLLAQHVIQPSPGFMLSNRVLPEEHFEFQRWKWSGLLLGRCPFPPQRSLTGPIKKAAIQLPGFGKQRAQWEEVGLK